MKDSHIFPEEAQAEEKAEKQNENVARAIRVAYRRTFQGQATSEEARLVLRDLLEKCHVFVTTMTGNSWTYFREGERNIGLYLLTQLNMATVEDMTGLMPQPTRKDEP